MILMIKKKSNNPHTQKELEENAKNSPYYNFCCYFLDDKENLKDIMQLLVVLSEEEERIKEELFTLLSFFILTYDYRVDRIKEIIFRNKTNLLTVIDDFKQRI